MIAHEEQKISLVDLQCLGHIPVEILYLIASYAKTQGVLVWDYRKADHNANLQVVECSFDGSPSKNKDEVQPLNRYVHHVAGKFLSNIFPCADQIIFFGRILGNNHSFLRGSTDPTYMLNAKQNPLLVYRYVARNRSMFAGLTFIEEQDQKITGYGFNDEHSFVSNAQCTDIYKFASSESPDKYSIEHKLLKLDDKCNRNYINVVIDCEKMTLRIENALKPFQEFREVKIQLPSSVVRASKIRLPSFAYSKPKPINLVPLIYSWTYWAGVYVPHTRKITEDEVEFFELLPKDGEMSKFDTADIIKAVEQMKEKRTKK